MYPTTRQMPILTSKSAPGIILASGVYGKNMKGHPSVYMSRDAGVTFKQVRLFIFLSYLFFEIVPTTVRKPITSDDEFETINLHA